MKKQLILILALVVCCNVFPQKTHRALGWKISKDIPKNELKINLATTIFAQYPEVTYEHVINEDFSLGTSLGVSLNENTDYIGFGLMPYARWFFGGSASSLQKYGAGFFIEANTAIIYDYFNYAGEEKELVAGMGLAVGWKYLSRNNWIGEFFFGAGRVFSIDGAYPRLGITIGKRF